MATKYTKETVLKRWRELAKRPQNPFKFMVPIPYKTEGSRYGACGVRIDGNPQFVDAVLSCLGDLLEGEGIKTRLELSRSVVKPVTIKGQTKRFSNSAQDGEVCYIRLHERGGESIICHAIMASMSKR